MIRYFFLFLFFTAEMSYGQRVVLNKDIKFDTLYVKFIQTDATDSMLNQELFQIFDSLVNDFNLQPNKFEIKIDSACPLNSITFTLGPIRYAKTRHNLLATGANAIVVGANILLWNRTSLVIPFWFQPIVHSDLMIHSKFGVLKKIAVRNINSSGYFRSTHSQKQRFKRKYQKNLVQVFDKLNRNYEAA